MEKRYNITISFSKEHEKLYLHAKKQPNCSHYMRDLIEKDMKNKEVYANNQIEEFAQGMLSGYMFREV